MARYIYSKIQPTRLLHIIHRLLEVKDKREDIIPPDNFLQIATIPLKNNQTFKPHRHIWNHFMGLKIAQEAWIVVRGKVKAVLYDIDNTILEKVELFPGDFSATLDAGHNYVAMSDDTLVFEVKTGPYRGINFDKESI